MSFWVQLEQVPAVVYVGVLGFVGTTLTIYFNNKASDDRAARQLREEREKDANRRLMDNRREVFLAAADVLAVGTTAIGQLSDFERPAGEITTPFVEGAGAIAKAHVFASYETSEALVFASQGIASAIIELTIQRVQLDISKKQVDSLDPTQTSTTAQRMSLLARQSILRRTAWPARLIWQIGWPPCLTQSAMT